MTVPGPRSQTGCPARRSDHRRQRASHPRGHAYVIVLLERAVSAVPGGSCWLPNGRPGSPSEARHRSHGSYPGSRPTPGLSWAESMAGRRRPQYANVDPALPRLIVASGATRDGFLRPVLGAGAATTSPLARIVHASVKHAYGDRRRSDGFRRRSRSKGARDRAWTA